MDPTTAEDAAARTLDRAEVAALLDEEYRLRKLIEKMQERYAEIVERNAELPR